MCGEVRFSPTQWRKYSKPLAQGVRMVSTNMKSERATLHICLCSDMQSERSPMSLPQCLSYRGTLGTTLRSGGTRMRRRLSANSVFSLPDTERTSQFPSASAMTGGLSSLRFSAADRERLAFQQLHRILSLTLSPLQFRHHQAPLCGPAFLPCYTRVQQ